MENILDITNLAFQGDAMRRLSSVLHESQNATQRGIEAAVPASIAGLAAHASSEQKAEELLSTFRGGNYPHVDANDMTRMVDDPAATTRLSQSGQGFLSRIFGTKLSGIIDAIAGQAGVSRASASTLMGLAAPLVLNQVGKETETRKLDARGLSQFLADQGRRASSVLPGPLTTAVGAIPGAGAKGRVNEGAFAGASVGTGNGRAKEKVESAVGDTSRRVRGGYDEVTRRVGTTHATERRGLGWLIGGLALLSLLSFLLFRSRGPEHAVTPQNLNLRAPDMPKVPEKLPEINLPKIDTPTLPEAPKAAPEAPSVETPPPPAAAPEAETTVPEPAPATLSVFLAGSDAAPRKFVLRGLVFASGSSDVTNRAVLDDVATALRAHPTAKVRIEGHTDAVGAGESNRALSQARADAVKSYLVEQGVTEGRMTTVGRAFEAPLVQTSDPNPENRRVDIIVTER